jgi:hypothetical protein
LVSSRTCFSLSLSYRHESSKIPRRKRLSTPGLSAIVAATFGTNPNLSLRPWSGCFDFSGADSIV